MAKKMAVVTIEFDDPEDSIETCSDLATDIEVMLGRTWMKNADVTVYSTPEDLALDTAEGLSIYADCRPDRANPVPLAAAPAPKS